MVLTLVGVSGAAASGIRVAAPKQIRHALTLFDMACPRGVAVTHSVCGVALQTDYNPYGISLIRGGVPGPATVVPPNGIHISCPTTRVCVLADRGGIGWVVNGRSTHIEPLGGMDVLNAISCTSASRCIAVGNSGDADHQRATLAVVTEGAEFANAHRIAGATNLNDVDCAGSTRCLAVGQAGQANKSQHAIAVQIVDGKPQTARPTSTLTTLTAVSCGTTTSCFASGSRLSGGGLHPYVVQLVSGKAHAPIPDRAAVTDLSCWNATDCLGVNIHAVVHFHAGHSVSSQHVKAPSPLQHVACPTSAGCLVMGGSYSGRQQVAVVRP